MAVYTDVSDDDLETFLGRYDLGNLLSFRGIAEGVENTNYLIETTTNRFILTVYEKRVDPRDLPFFVSLLEHLKASGIECPSPIRNRNGEALSTLAGKPAALFSYLNGVWIRKPRLTHCAAVGRALAQFHQASEDFGESRENSLSISDWRPLVEACRQDADNVLQGLSDDIVREIDFLEENWPSGLPTGVIHADLFPDNVFFLNDQLSGLIDFYFACTDFLAYDVAICINAWCFEPDHAFNVTKTRALLSEYQAVKPFNADEYAAIPILTRGAAFRFLLTRLYDWLNQQPGALVAPKDPLEYCKKLRFHRTMSEPADYAL